MARQNYKGTAANGQQISVNLDILKVRGISKDLLLSMLQIFQIEDLNEEEGELCMIQLTAFFLKTLSGLNQGANEENYVDKFAAAVLSEMKKLRIPEDRSPP